MWSDGELKPLSNGGRNMIGMDGKRFTHEWKWTRSQDVEKLTRWGLVDEYFHIEESEEAEDWMSR